MINLFSVAAFIAGAIAGSFFYTLALRYADGMVAGSPVRALFSRSRCPGCGVTPAPLYLVPVLGWFFSLGRCRSCGMKIPLYYPLWEIIFGLMAVAVMRVHGSGPAALSIYLICCVSVCIGIVDFITMKIPDSLLLALLIFSLYPVTARGEYMDSLYGFLLLSVFFLIMLLLFPGAFRMGDLKYYAIAGILLGLEQSVVLLEVSLVTGAVLGTVWGLARGGTLKQKIPFAPFISAALVITLLYGGRIALFYYDLMR